MHRASSYPKPKEHGGRLIRSVIRTLRGAGFTPPIHSHILIGVSGGLDSTALGHLLAKYGRRVADRSKLVFLHVNHGWRGAESEADEAAVRALGEALQVPVEVERGLPAEYAQKGESLEAAAREFRMEVFARHASRLAEGKGKQKKPAWVFTAHHRGDQAETVIWRILSGGQENQWAGIWTLNENIVRPLIDVPREWLEAYLKEEGLTYRQDTSNFDPRFLRARIRNELLPVVKKLFPRAEEALARVAVSRQSGAQRKLATRRFKKAK